ncbi:glutathione synthase [Acidiferrobacter sp.]|uniref:glutathione synthase n=1 Tax=Acidiferrobacter sp. TaxID=1872107 RepID=UPI0026315A50|nr:glutathione synthase [Acidiferrobacter sp.]
MTRRLAVVMDPVDHIKAYKDTTVALLREAASRGYSIDFLEARDLALAANRPVARVRSMTVRDSDEDWCELGDARDMALEDADVILMRKDPPFNMDYIYATYLLEHAQAAGALVINDPASLRNANEKLFATWFPDCTPPTLVTTRKEALHAFLREHGDIVVKPLDGMGGSSVFRVTRHDPNINVIFETMTGNEQRPTMAQRYLPEIAQGDKRILMIDGEPVPFALARVPAPGETRGNLAAGGTGVGRPLSASDRRICERVGPALRARGLTFVGLDVIGESLTEINVTSPTGLRELDRLFHLNIAADLFDVLERKMTKGARTP